VLRARHVVAALGALLALAAAAPAGAARPVPLAAYLVLDARTGQVLASRRPDAVRPIASVTKLMTAYLAIRAGAFDRSYVVPRSATLVGQSTVRLRAGQRVPGRLLLEAMFVPSANDAAVTLAVGVSGSRAAFVRLMNRTAATLGLSGTHYRSPDGLDARGQGSTARDVAVLARILVADARVLRISRMASIVVGTARYAARNTLLGRYRGLDGLKTGHTLGAGWCLVATASRHGRRVIVVALGAVDQPTRDGAVRRLLDAAFSGRSTQPAARPPRPLTVLAQGSEVTRLPVAFGGSAPIVVERPLRVPVTPAMHLALVYVVPDVLDPPADRGQAVGRVSVVAGGRVLATSRLVVGAAVSATGLRGLVGWFLSPLGGAS
jgi:D-alanyl-D-alanine carboxypeptidase (penicillin-binding protein 5/6)